MTAFRSRLWTLPDRRPWIALLLAILACEIVGASGSVFTTMGLESWYPSLTQPDLAPPNWVFAPVWTTLFALMGLAVWLVWREALRDRGPEGKVALGMFAIHFVINIAWSAVYFGMQSLLGGLIVIALLWVAIVTTIVLFDRVDRRAGFLLVPYVAWVSFAAYLNYAFWVLN